MSYYRSTHFADDSEVFGSNLLTGAVIFACWLVLMAITAGPAPVAPASTLTAANAPAVETVVVTGHRA